MEQEAVEFWEKVVKPRKELRVIKIYNADQSGICFEYLPKQTVSNKGAKTVWGKDKERFTGMFLADSGGNQYPPFVVMKAKPSTIHATAAHNEIVQHGFACWNSGLYVAFLDFHFADRDEDEPVLHFIEEHSEEVDDNVDNIAVDSEAVVAQLSSLNVIVDTISDDDDVVEKFIDEAAELESGQ
ncbi:hypothetical protein PHMEG_00016959 [Phytophthora megakarya]|uniref:Uncharacterized protein n=1 Tax=Phytophthora megakarya TaxID=4795 RepID=A0A225VYK6_9STRA|nr:hypothetical protein PHMEG_00016959 [Phytophthora megakarya]